MKMGEIWEKFRGKYLPPRKDQLLILVLLGVLLAVIAIPVEKKEEEPEADTSQEPSAAETEEDYEAYLERRLEEILSQVEEVGQVRVMVTLEGSGEKRVEKDESISADSSQEETVYEELPDGGSTPYVKSETNPQVEGVLVIAEGGGNSRIKQEIMEAVQALFGIEAHKIKIMKMEGSN